MRSEALSAPAAPTAPTATTHEVHVRVRDAIELLVLGALWGSSFLFMRVAAPEFGPIPLIAVRVTIAAILLGAIAHARGGSPAIRKHFLSLGFVGLVNSALPFCLFAFATLSLAAGFASVLNATTPLFGALIAVIVLRERIARMRVLGLAIGFLGVVLLVWHKLGVANDRIAILAGLTAALCYATVAYYTKRKLAGVEPLAIAAGSQIGSSLLLAVPALFLWPDHPISARAWGAACAVGLLGTALAYVLYFRLVRNIGPERSMVVTYLIPVFGVLWGHVVLGEAVTVDMVLAGGVVLCGTMLVAKSARRAVRR